jgi:hypothetical protein
MLYIFFDTERTFVKIRLFKKLEAVKKMNQAIIIFSFLAFVRVAWQE